MPGGEPCANARKGLRVRLRQHPLLMACAAVGARAARRRPMDQHEAHISDFAVVACLAVPVAVFSQPGSHPA